MRVVAVVHSLHCYLPGVVAHRMDAIQGPLNLDVEKRFMQRRVRQGLRDWEVYNKTVIYF